jgi:myo-inositol-1(or 4)-monophosphatase
VSDGRTPGTSGRAAMSREGDLDRIGAALDEVAAWLAAGTGGVGRVDYKDGDDPVTATDRGIDALLRRVLPRAGEGWLSEESADDLSRLERSRVWVVDPLDGTREFVAGIPEWSVSIGLVEDGEAVAGGVLNPTTGQRFLGALGHGVTLGGRPAGPGGAATLAGAVVLASRSEVKRGEWERFAGAAFTVKPTGSVAFKLACVAAGLADATWTLVPKHEWDVAAGVALLRAAGCVVRTLDGGVPRFNRPAPLLAGLIACPEALAREIAALLDVALDERG